VWKAVCEEDEKRPENIEKVGGGYGKGYLFAVDKWRQLTKALDALRDTKCMSCILIGHTRVRRYDDPIEGSYDRFEWDIHAKAENMMYRWCDSILFASFKAAIVRKEEVGFDKTVKRAIDISQGERYLYTQKRPGHPGGGRGIWGRLPYEIPMSWDSLMDAAAKVK
jgi:hypothetical protein